MFINTAQCSYTIKLEIKLNCLRGRPQDVRSPGEGVCPVLTRKEGGSSDTDVRTFWEQKTSDFSKFMVCPLGQGGRGSASADKKGQFFESLCGYLSWTAHQNTRVRYTFKFVYCTQILHHWSICVIFSAEMVTTTFRSRCLFLNSLNSTNRLSYYQ